MSFFSWLRERIAGKKQELKRGYEDAPSPMFKFTKGKIIHAENKLIIAREKALPILEEKDLKATQAEYKTLRARLARLDPQLERRAFLLDEIERLKYEGKKLQREFKEATSEREKARLLSEGESAFACVNLYRQELKALENALEPYRVELQLMAEFKRTLDAHWAAVEDRDQDLLLKDFMAKEASTVAQMIVETLTRLGLAYEYTNKKGRTKVDKVKIARVVATPFDLQIKVDASRQGLFGGGVSKLPRGVFSSNLVEDKVLNTLSAVLERPVDSPNSNDECLPHSAGIWYVMSRLGIIGGIPSNVSYRSLMERIENKRLEHFPIPFGLKTGKAINWIELDSPLGVHTMYTGVTFAGKSNSIRAMTCALIETQSPDAIRFVFVDLKRQGDFTAFAKAPHTLIAKPNKPILNEVTEVLDILRLIQSEMNYRQEKIGAIALDLTAYNKKVTPAEKFPRIVFVIDELASIRRKKYSEEADEIEEILTWIGQVGRSVGVHLWLGIQQPTSSNMPSQLRYNITIVANGQQGTMGASMSASGNAETLKLPRIPGRVLVTMGAHQSEAQMPYISMDEVESIVQRAGELYGESVPYVLCAPEPDPDAEPAPAPAPRRDPDLEINERDSAILRAIANHEEGMGATVRKIIEVTEMKQATVYKGLTRLKERGLVYKHHEAHYLEDKGRAALDQLERV